MNFFFHFQVTNSKFKNKELHFELLTRWLNFYFFALELLTGSSKNKTFRFKLLTWWVHFYFLTFNLRKREVDKWKKLLNHCSFKMTWTASFYSFLLFRLLSCKHICDICLSMLDFNGLWKFNNIFINKITTCRSI